MSLLKHMERWEDIEGYEGLYQVSNCGRVNSLGNGKSNNSKERILKPGKNRDGYLIVKLHKDGKQKTYYVHRLVAEAFIPNPLNLPEVNHKTENKQLNYSWCIEWCDHKYNNNYGTRNERVSKAMVGVLINREDQSKKVICVETNTVYPSAMEAERQTGINNGNIIKCCKGKYKKAGGYQWQYAD